MTGKVLGEMGPFLHTDQHKVIGTTKNKLPSVGFYVILGQQTDLI